MSAPTVAVRERPILFSGPMMRAILAGQKTQTRRVVKPQPNAGPNGEMVDLGGACFGLADGVLSGAWHCPYGERGDRLWVRETWAIGLPALATGEGFVPFCGRLGERAESPVSHEAPRAKIVYAASWDGPDVPPFRPSIHMPRWASRLTLEITDVRAERVQDITEDDAKAEGVDGVTIDGREYTAKTSNDWRFGFQQLWDLLNAPRGYAWATNLWVWVIAFRRVDA